MRFTDSTLVKAPPDVVWRLTIDVTSWPSLSPTMTRVERLDDGPIQVGSSARVKQPAQPAGVWTVTRLDDQRAFVWQTVRPGLTMVGSHLLAETEAGCQNTLELELIGPLATPIGLLLGPLMRRSIRQENAGFKAEAEHLYQN